MRLPRLLHTIVLTWHILAAAGWFALVAVQLIAPRAELRVYLISAAGVALASGLILALASQVGLLKHWWVLAKLLGSAAVGGLGVASLAGYQIPDAAYGGLLGLWALVWLSVARPWGKTPYGYEMARRGRHGR